jgi:uncharacterized cupin superfamily protein
MNTIIHADSQRAAVVKAGQGSPLHVIGNRVTQKLTLAETAGAYYVFEVVTPPGAGVPPHVHKHEDEIIYLIDGQLSILLGDRRFQAGSGDTIHFPRFQSHAFQNNGATDARTLWTVIPGSRFEQFFLELAALPAGPPDLEKVGAIFHRYEITLI